MNGKNEVILNDGTRLEFATVTEMIDYVMTAPTAYNVHGFSFANWSRFAWTKKETKKTTRSED